jgi:hypothetical protein
MTTIALQAGHQHIQNNCSADMRSGTGAPGERDWTPVIRAKVAAILKAHNFGVAQLDANANCAATHPRYDLTLAIHYQSNTGHSGFGVFVPDASVDRDSATSVKLAKVIAKTYGERTKLTNYSSPRLGFGPVTWENPNTLFYYLWQYQNGPLALIECGEGAIGAPDHALLWTKQDVIASAIAEGICLAFGKAFVAAPVPSPIPPAPVPVPFPTPVPVPEPPPVKPPVVVNPPIVTHPPLVPVPDPAPEPPPGGWAALIAWIRRVLGL